MSGYLEHTTTEGDRWDLLAWRYYGDALAYERIIATNPSVPIIPVLPSGVRLVIPMAEAAAQAVEPPPWKSYE